ncbi:MAG: ABC transporter substrate-binding protein [Acidimicrobiales bacterium]
MRRLATRRLAATASTVLVATSLAACSTSSAGPSGAKKPAVFTTIDESHAITAGAPMNPFNPSGNTFDSYDQMELGYSTFSAAHPNAMFPALAAHWKLVNGGTALDVFLQPKARWSTGAPVTANDVKVSTAIAYTQGSQPPNLAGVKILGSKEVQFQTIPGTVNQLFTNGVLSITVVPASVYGGQLPSSIWSTIAQSEYAGTSAAKKAAATKAQATLTTIGKKVAAFAPAKDVSAGPFVLSRINPGEALLTRNKYFYAASKISPTSVVMRNYTGNQQIWNYLIAGQLDATPYTSMPLNVLKSVLKTKGNQELKTGSYVATALAFNEKDYPWNMLAARQAVAYVLNRKQITSVAEAVSGIPATYQTGLINSINSSWLSSSQLAKLKQYRPNPSKAAKLLTAAGFAKKAGKWYMPNGKPWTMTIEAVSGFSDWITGAKFIASSLTSFGIPSTISIAPDYATYLSNLKHGQYPVGLWLNALGPSVSAAYSRIWGSNDGFSAVGNVVSHTSKNNWTNTPVSYTLPGYGTIQPGALTAQLTQLSATASKPLVAKLAVAANTELPMITLWDFELVQFVNNTRFTDWPIHNGAVQHSPPGVWMMQGYVHAR